MADAFTILGSEPSVERLGPSKTRRVYIVTARATESQTVFWIKVRLQDYSPGYINQRAGVVAEEMNTLAAKPGVVGVRVLEDTTPEDSLQQVVIVTVESSSGDSQDDVTLSWGEAQGAAGYTKVAAARAKLNEIESL